MNQQPSPRIKSNNINRMLLCHFIAQQYIFFDEVFYPLVVIVTSLLFGTEQGLPAAVQILPKSCISLALPLAALTRTLLLLLLLAVV
mmetsp:Transcript_47923/g.94946  ORF Transcript_47923/g.94946 Transcript_47923/m.94946 type:complete len:87 (+) Transcript_47923:206-466(+)